MNIIFMANRKYRPVQPAVRVDHFSCKNISVSDCMRIIQIEFPLKWTLLSHWTPHWKEIHSLVIFACLRASNCQILLSFPGTYMNSTVWDSPVIIYRNETWHNTNILIVFHKVTPHLRYFIAFLFVCLYLRATKNEIADDFSCTKAKQKRKKKRHQDEKETIEIVMNRPIHGNLKVK